jgi:hypothetical protein
LLADAVERTPSEITIFVPAATPRSFTVTETATVPPGDTTLDGCPPTVVGSEMPFAETNEMAVMLPALVDAAVTRYASG